MRSIYLVINLNHKEVYVETILNTTNITLRAHAEAAKMRARDLSRLMPAARVTVTIEKLMTTSELAELTGSERIGKPWILSRTEYKHEDLIKHELRDPSIIGSLTIAQIAAR
jgi:hypothetical protein